MCNLIGVDKGAFTMAKHALERAGNHEIESALVDAAVPIEEVLQQVANADPALYMRFVTDWMMCDYM